MQGDKIMLDISRDIKPLSNFKRNSVAVIGQLKRTGRPVVLTINGKAEVVVQDAKSYQHLLELIDQAEAVMGIRKGLASMERGEGVPAEQAFEKIRKKHKIPRGK
jgi:PHD/YefM family antitoxin component YafN of YafNO toxin-antitoxin module